MKSASKDAKDKDEINKRIKTLEELKDKINSTIVDEKKKKGITSNENKPVTKPAKETSKKKAPAKSTKAVWPKIS